MIDRPNSDKNKTDLKRRAVIKALGASSALAVGTQTVAAWGDTEITQEDLKATQKLLESIEEVSRSSNTNVLHRGRDIDEFEILLSAIEADYESVQITDRTAYRVDELGIYIAQFHVTVKETGHDGEIIAPVDNPRLSSDERYNDVNLDPSAVINGYSDDAPVEINRYVIGDQTGFSTSGYAGVSKHTVINDITRITIDLTTAKDEVQTYSATCSQCKLVMGALNASSCGLGTVLTCSVVTAKTVVGPVACAAIVPVVCFIIQNYGTNDPEKTCAGEDMFGNKVLPGGYSAFC